MTRTRRIRWGLALAVLVLAALPARPAPAPDGDSPLAIVPAQSPVVLHQRGIERNKERLTILAKNALPDLAAQIQTQIDDLYKQALEGRALKGLVKDGSVFIIVTELPPADDPEKLKDFVAFALRVENYAAFRDGLLTEDERKALKKEDGYEATRFNDEPIYLLDRGGYAIFTANKDLAIRFTKKQAGLDTKLSKDLAAKLLEPDAGLYVDMAAVNKKYAEEIKQGRQNLEDLIKQAEDLGGLTKSNRDAIKALIGPAFQAVQDAQVLLVTANFKPAGLVLRIEARVGEESKTNTILKTLKPSALGELTRLPGGQMIYTAGQSSPALDELWGQLQLGFGSAKDTQAFKEAVAQIAAARLKARYSSVTMPMQGLQVEQYEDPAKAVAGQMKLLQALDQGDSYGSGVLKGKPEVKADAQKYRGFTFNFVSATWDIDEILKQQGAKDLPEPLQKQMGEAMKKLMGEGTKAWFGTNDQLFLQATAADWEAAKKMIDQFLDKKELLGDQEAFQAVRKELPAEATQLLFMDLPMYTKVIVAFVQEMLKGFPLLPFNLQGLQLGAGKASYVGVAITLKPETGSVDVWVPAMAAQEIYKIFAPLLKGAGILLVP